MESNNNSSIASLIPAEIWEEIFKYLPFKSLLPSTLVSKSWNEIISNSTRFKSKLFLSLNKLTFVEHVDEDAINAFRIQRKYRGLFMRCRKRLKAAQYQHLLSQLLKTASDLHSVYFDDCEFSIIEFIHFVQQCKNVQRLTISLCTFHQNFNFSPVSDHNFNFCIVECDYWILNKLECQSISKDLQLLVNQELPTKIQLMSSYKDRHECDHINTVIIKPSITRVPKSESSPFLKLASLKSFDVYGTYKRILYLVEFQSFQSRLNTLEISLNGFFHRGVSSLYETSRDLALENLKTYRLSKMDTLVITDVPNDQLCSRFDYHIKLMCQISPNLRKVKIKPESSITSEKKMYRVLFRVFLATYKILPKDFIFEIEWNSPRRSLSWTCAEMMEKFFTLETMFKSLALSRDESVDD